VKLNSAAQNGEAVGLSSDGRPLFRRPMQRLEAVVPSSISVCDLALTGDGIVVSRCGGVEDGSVVALPLSDRSVIVAV